MALLGERRLRTRLLAAGLKASAACAVVVALSAASAGTPTGAAPEPAGPAGPAGSDCSFRGAAAGDSPPTALIRTPRGQVREVPFAVGWDVYNGRRPGSLLAVCTER
ncbi:hypothetical protein G5V58_21300 [Nocardioides anomalus]|uniref:Uncharacterized protein n=1 Tax=Nocardioides anomalus TaxID=2712223 RepID=A0A6G6WI11_9ACTN|nr:hypothetical protein [Nocardioides anomalus]QIG44968.1 hypothetical protein G5V58_21300 [Nocardioides anomalus]